MTTKPKRRKRKPMLVSALRARYQQRPLNKPEIEALAEAAGRRGARAELRRLAGPARRPGGGCG